jgi:probable F420-dependent oxidoreductase
LVIDAEIHSDRLDDIPRLARQAEDFGLDGIWFDETKHDPFVQLALAAPATRRVTLGSAIALAFTRSPTLLAYSSWDIQSLAEGRFVLGLGSQVKGHIERRFGSKWESPGPKMLEVISALRGVWKNWQDGTPLVFHGRFYNIDLMTPFFSPPKMLNPSTLIIPVFVAGVNRGMYRIAGEAADGLHVHPLHTVKYLKEVMNPALISALEKGRRNRDDFQVACSIFAAVGSSEAEIRQRKEESRASIAFYASTRTYRKILELHNWGDVCDRLHELSVRGEWKRMATEVTDDMLDQFVVEGSWEGIGSVVEKRYAGLVDRVRLYLPFDGNQKWRSFVQGFRA